MDVDLSFMSLTPQDARAAAHMTTATAAEIVLFRFIAQNHPFVLQAVFRPCSHDTPAGGGV